MRGEVSRFPEADVSIRPYVSSDRQRVLALDFETGFLGSSLEPLIDRREIFTRSLDWYLRRFPDTSFVADVDGMVRGYVVCSSRDVSVSAAAATTIGFLSDSLRIPWLGAKDRRYVRSRFRTAFQSLWGEARKFRTPRGPRLHVTLDPAVRGGGLGSRLLEAVVVRLRAGGAAMVHANAYRSVHNDTSGFWIRNGFEEFTRVRTTAWADFIDEPVELVCWAKRL